MFDWEAWGEKETAWGSHGSQFHETIGKPFDDFGWLEKLEEGKGCRMKEMEDKMEARGRG